MLLKIEKIYDRASDYIGYFTGVLMILTMLNVFYDVIMRYFFKTGSIAMQEMEWHLFSLVFLLGITYALKEEGHVRVDVIYDNLPIKRKSIINIIGTLAFLIPFSLLIAFDSIPFVVEAYTSGEISGDPGGLHHRWLIKAIVPFSFFLLALFSLGYAIKNINIYRGTSPSLTAKEGAAK